ncbi:MULTISPECIES: NAD(P)H-dependent oxidoreductase [unclassified Streptomyces]|uniref:NAD(P)H-dependent oxidoreductase n=1 Tax=unclassified Streptomyces TaxID=2593676 RepID=UPI00380C6947
MNLHVILCYALHECSCDPSWKAVRCPISRSLSWSAAPVPAKVWAAKIAEYDGFVFVTPEHNRSPSGVLKNAMTSRTRSGPTRPQRSSATARPGGARAIEHLRGRVDRDPLRPCHPRASLTLLSRRAHRPPPLRGGPNGACTRPASADAWRSPA